jgi:prophage antirepressor-like protein
MNFINEGNLYRLILKSQLPAAEKFESWVCDEVLPTLRRTGRYELPLMLVTDELPNVPRGHVFSVDYLIFGSCTVRRVMIDGRAYYCLVDIQHAAGMDGRHRSQLARSIYRNYTFKIRTKTNRRTAAYISADGVEVLLSRSTGEGARHFLAEFLRERDRALPVPDLKRLLEVVVRTADRDDRLFLYEWYGRLLKNN